VSCSKPFWVRREGARHRTSSQRIRTMPCMDAKPDSEAPGGGYRHADRDGPTRQTQTGNSGREAAITLAPESDAYSAGARRPDAPVRAV
jgi:hypothetical protein